MLDHTAQTFIPIQFDKSHLSTIGGRLYTQSLDLIRELVANAYDADATTVKITVGDDTIVVEDNGMESGKGLWKEGTIFLLENRLRLIYNNYYER